MYIYQDLPRQYLDNIGGTLAKIQLLSANASPAGDFEHLSYPEDNLIVTDDSFIGLNDFKTFGLIMDTTSYESGIVDIDGDQVTETVFKGKMPRVTLAGIQVCSSFVKYRYLAIVTDRNGLRRKQVYVSYFKSSWRNNK